MASPLLLAAVVLLASEATAGPTILEWLSGIQYVPPAGWVDTSDPPCQDCTGRALFGLLAPATPPCCSGCLKCGVERQRRIVGGTETTPGKYPWIAVYKINGAAAVGGCAATLVSSDWAVTAAHCVAKAGVISQAGITATSFTLILGEHTITTTDDEFDGNRKEVALAMDPIIHPLFDISSPDYNIALLKLAESVDLGVYTPVCLPAATDDFTGGTTKASVYGWGLTDFCDLTSFATTLRETEVTIITNEACAAISTEVSDCSTPPITITINITGPGLPGGITDRVLCGLAPGKGACLGDDGSPLTVESGGQHTLAGTVSAGTCGLGDSTGLPGLYANVANLRTWLDTAINANGGFGGRCLL